MLTFAHGSQPKRKMCYCHILEHYVRVGRCANRKGAKHDYCREMQARNMMSREMSDVGHRPKVTRKLPRTGTGEWKRTRVAPLTKRGTVPKRESWWTEYRSQAEHDRAYGLG